jgi:hypothetical protein
MTKRETEQVLAVLERIKDPDGHVILAQATVKKQLAMFDARKGQLKGDYSMDYPY